MARDHRQEVIILHCRRVQEFHKTLVYLSRSGGVHEAVLHGAYKGKGRLAGSSEPFCRLRLMLYHNPVKDSWKVNDGELICSYDGIRGDLARVYLASLWAEILIATRGAGNQGGEAEAVYLLLAEALEVLEGIPREKLPRLSVQFLWRFLELAGFGLDFRNCGRCGRPLGEREVFFYEPQEHGFFCSRCQPTETVSPGRRRGLPPGILGYLNYSLSRDLPQSLRAVLAGENGSPGAAGEDEASGEPSGLETLEAIPLDFLRREMGFSPRTPDYRLFL